MIDSVRVSIVLRPFLAPHQPPLRWWTQAWLLALALLLGVLVLAYFGSQGSYFPGPTVYGYEWPVLDLVFGVVAVVVVAFRRRAPVLVNVVVLGISGVSFAASGAVLLALLSLATRRRWVELLPITVLTVLITQVSMMLHLYSGHLGSSFWWDMLVFYSVFYVAVVAVGMYLGSRQELEWVLRDRAEAEQECGTGTTGTTGQIH
jgi:hypothetical protein